MYFDLQFTTSLSFLRFVYTNILEKILMHMLAPTTGALYVMNMKLTFIVQLNLGKPEKGEGGTLENSCRSQRLLMIDIELYDIMFLWRRYEWKVVHFAHEKSLFMLIWSRLIWWALQSSLCKTASNLDFMSQKWWNFLRCRQTVLTHARQKMHEVWSFTGFLLKGY